MSDINKGDLNTNKLNLMKVRIIKAEQKNLQTREKSTDAMVETIRKIIETEVNKTY